MNSRNTLFKLGIKLILWILGIAGPRGKAGRPGTNGTPGLPGVSAYKLGQKNISELLIPPSIAGT